MQTDDEKVFIEDLNHWPVWPFMPMKRRVENGPNTGVLVDRTPFGRWGFTKKLDYKFDFFPGANIWVPLEKWDRESMRENVNIDELLNEGWRVD